MAIEKRVQEAIGNAGKAYAFFDSNVSKNRMDAGLNTARRIIVPSLNLERLTGVPEIKLVQHADKKHHYEFRLPGYSNEETANAAADAMDGLYQDEDVYKKGEPFVGDIVHFKKDGNYAYHD